MNIIAYTGKEDLAMVYLAETAPGRQLEFVESLQPPRTRAEKWVLIVSTMYGCPVRCRICDAGGFYHGKVSAEDIMGQIAAMVHRRYPDGRVPVKKFKIQFARMGEPALNDAVLEVLERLPHTFQAPGLLPSVSTIAPHGREGFFHRLLEIRDRLYRRGGFQFQFSLHSSDEAVRDRLIPVRKLPFSWLGEFGREFHRGTGQQVTLNFALGRDIPLHADELLRHFDPHSFLIKLTPVNPTYQAVASAIASRLTPHAADAEPLAAELRRAGYRVIVSIGETEENRIGSNCGQYVRRHLLERRGMHEGYRYSLNRTPPG